VELEIETNESKQNDVLNQDCWCALDLESMLLAHSDKIPFSTASVRSRKARFRGHNAVGEAVV
jgi:hypothetical protein